MNKETKRKKRACIIRQKYYPMQRNLRRNAETLTREGYQVDVICVGAKGQPRSETVNGINVHRIYFSYHRNNVFWYLFDYMAFFMLASWQLFLLSFGKRPDVIEVCNVPDFLVFCTLFPKLLGSKVIYYIFEKSEALFTASFGLSRKHILTRLYNLIIKCCARYADHVIATDVVVQKQLADFYGIRPEKVTLVLNVVDETVFKLEPAAPADNKHFRLVIVSGILKRYGIQTMVRAVPLLLKDIPQLQLDIVGGGDNLPQVQKLAEELKLGEYINFTGNIPYEDVPPYIARADICVAPMSDDVGTPNKILEYFGMGKATVSSYLPGMAALVDNNCIVYFEADNEADLAEKIIDLYHHPEKRASLGKAAQEFYDQHRWAKTKQAYLGVYQKLHG